jgi:hypothetical protein
MSKTFSKIRQIVRRIKEIVSYMGNAYLKLVLFTRPSSAKHLDCILVTQCYNSKSAERRKELEDCLAYNASQPWISKVILFHENDSTIPLLSHRSIFHVNIRKRLSYSDVFEWFKLNPPSEESVIILANSDIFITTDVRSIIPAIRINDFLALTRYESFSEKKPLHITTNIPGAVSISQDTWIFLSSAAELLAESAHCDIPLGILGCESSLLAKVYNCGFKISNPCLNTRTVHNHKSLIRSYSPADRLLGVYAYPMTMTKEQFLLGKRYPPLIDDRDKSTF